MIQVYDWNTQLNNLALIKVVLRLTMNSNEWKVSQQCDGYWLGYDALILSGLLWLFSLDPTNLFPWAERNESMTHWANTR